MVDIKRLEEMNPEELQEIKRTIALFKLLGMTDEDINALPGIAKNWSLIIKNMNDMMQDLLNIKEQLHIKGVNKNKKESEEETEVNLRKAFGFDKNTESIDLGGGGNG